MFCVLDAEEGVGDPFGAAGHAEASVEFKLGGDLFSPVFGCAEEDDGAWAFVADLGSEFF